MTNPIRQKTEKEASKILMMAIGFNSLQANKYYKRLADHLEPLYRRISELEQEKLSIKKAIDKGFSETHKELKLTEQYVQSLEAKVKELEKQSYDFERLYVERGSECCALKQTIKELKEEDKK